jgi:hypothetical protein
VKRVRTSHSVHTNASPHAHQTLMEAAAWPITGELNGDSCVHVCLFVADSGGVSPSGSVGAATKEAPLVKTDL